MGTFVELFHVLDGLDIDDLPERIDIRADETLADVQRLRAAGRAADARHLIVAEIRRLRPMVRSTRLHAVELVQEAGYPEFRLQEYLAKLHWLASQTLLAERQWDEARYHLVRAVELTPDDATPCYSLVEVYEGMREYASGWGLLKRTLPAAPDRFGPLFQFALSVRRSGESATADSFFREIRDDDPIGIFRELSNLFLVAPRPPHPPPDALEQLWSKGSALVRAGQYDQALQTLSELLSWDVTHARTWFILGYLYDERRREQQESPIVLPRDDAIGFPMPFQVTSAERQDDLRRAAQAYRMAVFHGEHSAEVHHRLATTYLNMGFPRHALDPAKRAAELAPDNASTAINLANILMENDKLGEALTIANAVLQRDEHSAVAHLVLGRILARLGHKEAADEYLARYLLDRLGPEEGDEPGT